MLKVAVIGGGSTYTPELLMGFIAAFILFRSNGIMADGYDRPRALEDRGGVCPAYCEQHMVTLPSAF